MSDDELLWSYLAAAREGDDVAVAALVRATQPFVEATCRALGSGGNVDDLAQEVYLRAFTAIGRFRGESTVRTWLARIVRNVCADSVRRRQRRRRLADRIAAQPQTRHAADLAGAVDASSLLDEVDAARREAFVLTQIVGLSYDEAADVLGCPVGTIRSRVSRARAELAAAEARVWAAS